MNNLLAINTCNVSKKFNNFKALNNLSVSVTEGEIFGFIGKNGAGKTTFLRIVCGLMQPSSGTVEVKKQISFLPQNVQFRDNMDGAEVLRFFAELRGSSVENSYQFADELELDLTKRINVLSPGQQRKLQLVIATIKAPEILVLDEPTAGLDPSGVQQVREIIRVLNREGCTVFISSHVLMELENLCQRIAIIEKGELLYQGACNAVYEIETEGINENILSFLVENKKKTFETEGNLLLARIERNEVPSVLQILYEMNVKVFSVRRQGIESLYNRVLKAVS